MGTCQSKTGQVMVEGSRSPAASGVAGSAAAAELPVMGIITSMAGKTIGRCAQIDFIDVT
jgi:hypothetical protein